MAATEEENWFGQTNKYKYQDLMIALYKKDIIDLKTVHAKLEGTGVLIDTGRFTKGKKLHNPNGLFDLFGEFRGQTVDEVRDLMIGWIYDNYRNVQGWTRMAMQHKNIEMNSWLKDMQKSTTHGDDIALYILSRMFNKHVFVHNSMYGWSTLLYHMEDNYQDVVDKCDLELVFLKCWAFGEVKKICVPSGIKQPNAADKNNTQTNAVIPSSVSDTGVIPRNVRHRSDHTPKQTPTAPPKKITQCNQSIILNWMMALTCHHPPTPPPQMANAEFLKKTIQGSHCGS